MKRTIGKIRNKLLVEGDINLIKPNEILVTSSEGYTILRKKIGSEIKTYVVVPLEEFKNEGDK